MELTIKDRLMEIENQLSYFQPTDEWQPQKYNVFLDRLEQIINELRLLIDGMKTENEALVKADISKAEELLGKYLTLKETYY